jgi:hypothetical protein
MQSQKRFESARRHLRDDFAGAIRMEAVDHDTVETGQNFQLPRGFLCQILQRGGLPDASQHQSDHFAGIDIGIDDARLGFDHQVDAGEMNCDVERLAAVLQLHRKDSLDGIGPGEIVHARADGSDRALAEQVIERPPQDLVGSFAKIVGGVFRRRANGEIGQQGEQESKWLHARSQMDRLAIAIGQVDLLLHDAAGHRNDVLPATPGTSDSAACRSRLRKLTGPAAWISGLFKVAASDIGWGARLLPDGGGAGSDAVKRRRNSKVPPVAEQGSTNSGSPRWDPPGPRRTHPRPTNGIMLAITVMNSTLVSSGRPAM